MKDSLGVRDYAVLAAIDNSGTRKSIRMERAMLELIDNFAAIALLSEEDVITCDMCDQEAFIFQEDGNYCLDCWQQRTEPKI